MRNIHRLEIAGLFICLIATLLLSAVAQDPAPERVKPRLKNFGSSLLRLKWDANKNAVVETKYRKRNNPNDDYVVRVETNLVVTDVLVVDKEWRTVQGLTRDDFIVTEDGQPQEVAAFSLGDDSKIPRSIVLIIDYSGSELPFIQTSIKAAKTLIDKLNPHDIMAIVTDDVDLVVDFTRDRGLLKKKLDSLEKKATSEGLPSRRAFGSSNQYSALMATLNEAFDDQDQRPIVIFQTDGDELRFLRNSPFRPRGLPAGLPPGLRGRSKKSPPFWRTLYQREFSYNDVYKAAEKSRATIYSIIPGYPLIGLSPEKQLENIKAAREKSQGLWDINPEVKVRLEGEFNKLPPEAIKDRFDLNLSMQSALAGVAKITGGWHDFLDDPSQADTIYSLIFSDINRRYVVGYYPTNKDRDGKRRKITVTVRNHPEYAVWGRKSYYAPEPE
jgi:VWFA-related protein